MQREFIATLDWIQTALETKDKAQYWSKWRTGLANPSDLSTFSFFPDLSTITHLPSLSFILHIPFQLQKPYLSKDERDFYLLDNPLRKEKVFQIPMVAATSWKGALRAAIMQELVEWWNGLGESAQKARQNRKRFVIRRLQLASLFGTEKGVQMDEKKYGQYLDRLGGTHQARWYRRYIRRFVAANGFFAGRLYFYPTFFDRIGLEVINPHDRKSGVGARGPILMECVPRGTKGDLLLLYVPFGPIGQGEDERRTEVAEDLQVIAEGVQAMLITYGFGAKTSSGFGTAEDRLAGEGKLVIRAKLTGEAIPSETTPEPQQPDLPRYLASPTQLHADLRREDGSLKSEAEYRAWIESQGRKYGKRYKQLYKKAQKWWEREGKQLMEAGEQEPATEPEPTPAETPPVAEFTFHTLSELLDLAQRVAAQLQEGGEV